MKSKYIVEIGESTKMLSMRELYRKLLPKCTLKIYLIFLCYNRNEYKKTTRQENQGIIARANKIMQWMAVGMAVMESNKVGK